MGRVVTPVSIWKAVIGNYLTYKGCCPDITVTQVGSTEASNLSRCFFIGYARIGAMYHSKIRDGEQYAIIHNVGE